MFGSAIQRLNDRRDSAGDAGADAGFTLIELMVVLLILAILLAIAIPTFLGVTGGANDRAAQSNLNTALTNVKSQGTQNGQTYTGLTTAAMKGFEPSLSWVSGAVTTQGPVSMYVSSDGNGVVLSSFSKNGSTCWYAVDNTVATADAVVGGPYVNGSAIGTATGAPTAAGTFYGKGTGACNASAGMTGAIWQPTSFPT
jgi:type IV pilus assembly protein PilA